MKTQPLVIRITSDAAVLLGSLRRPGESWSDVVMRCAKTEKEAQDSLLPMVSLVPDQSTTDGA